MPASVGGKLPHVPPLPTYDGTMNTITMAMTALNATRSALSALNEYREKKQAEAYDALVDVTDNLPDDITKEAGALTASAKRRLAQTWDKATDAASDAADTVASEAKRLGTDGKKMSKKLAKKADKAADKARTKAQKKIDKAREKKPWWQQLLRILGIGALIAAVATLIGWAVAKVLDRRQEVGDTPPRVEEHREDGESRLVYSTETPADEEAADAEQDSEQDSDEAK